MAETDDALPYVGAREWVDVMSRLRLNDVASRKRIAPRTVKAVAWRLAWWADGQDGTRVHPGIALIAVVCEVDYKTAKGVVAVLRDLGLLTIVSTASGPKGRRSRVADEYRLTIPPDLLDRARVLSPLELQTEVQQVRDANAGKRVAGSGVPRNSPVDNPLPLELQGTDYPATRSIDSRVAGYSRPPEPGLRGNQERVAGAAVPRHLLGDQTTKPIDHDPVPAQPPVACETMPPNEKLPVSKKCCEHGLAAGVREDGLPRCAFCRRDAAPIAPVIPIRHGRSAS